MSNVKLVYIFQDIYDIKAVWNMGSTDDNPGDLVLAKKYYCCQKIVSCNCVTIMSPGQ